MELSQSSEKQTILIAEDDRLVRHLVRTILEGAGYQLVMAENGRRALEVAAAYDGPIHLLLSDVQMPEMNGPDLADRLQAARPGTPVVFMSGFTNGALRDHAEYPFVPKPFSPATLLGTLRAVLAAASRIAASSERRIVFGKSWCPSPRPTAG